MPFREMWWGPLGGSRHAPGGGLLSGLGRSREPSLGTLDLGEYG